MALSDNYMRARGCHATNPPSIRLGAGAGDDAVEPNGESFPYLISGGRKSSCRQPADRSILGQRDDRQSCTHGAHQGKVVVDLCQKTRLPTVWRIGARFIVLCR
jgi:hypothetical protein